MKKTDNDVNNSKVYTLYYAFFLIPLMITMIGVMFFFVFKVLTYETNSPNDYLTEIQIGSATKRWQAAFELSKILSNSNRVPKDKVFMEKMINLYKKSIHDDPMVRTYLAMAMGCTGHKDFGPSLMEGLQDRDAVTRLAAIKSLGNIKYVSAIEGIKEFLKEKYSSEERLAAVISLGNIGDKSVIIDLQNILDDEEPNIRWDAAIALAKLEDSSGNDIISNLLDRSYFDQFSEVNSEEEVQAILVAIQISSNYPSDKFVTNLMKLATFDHNMQIRDMAIKTLSQTYDRKI